MMKIGVRRVKPLVGSSENLSSRPCGRSLVEHRVVVAERVGFEPMIPKRDTVFRELHPGYQTIQTDTFPSPQELTLEDSAIISTAPERVRGGGAMVLQDPHDDGGYSLGR